MDNWWLIYNEADVQRNRAYIDMYFASCGKRGIDLRLVTVDAVPSDPEKLCSGQPLPSKAINRSRDWQLSAYLEEKGVRVYNDSHTAELGNDKLKAVRFAEKLGIPVPVTAENESGIDTWPKVMKSRGGHGGTEVFLLHDRNEYEALKDTKTADGSSFIFQKPVSDMGKDLRIYITGGEITAAMMRQSYNDFRSNYCLGGTASVHELTDEERQIAEKICSELHPAHIGIDLIYDDGKPVFNEIEDAVGSRMLYRYTDIDVVELYVAHVLGGQQGGGKKFMNIDALGFLDTETGLAFCGDDEEFYAEVLQGYIDGDRSDELDKLFDVQDWKGYQIAIHAVKSTSKTIGAMDMSEKAKALEQACKDMDGGYITEKHKAVMEEYRELIAKIKNAL